MNARKRLEHTWLPRVTREDFAGLEVARSAFARGPRPTTQDAKLQVRCVARVWLGKVLESDEHIVAGVGEEPATKTRVVRRKIEAERWSKEKLLAVACTPWAAAEKIAGAAMPTRPRRYITKGDVLSLGQTAGCHGYDGRGLIHAAPWKVRF